MYYGSFIPRYGRPSRPVTELTMNGANNRASRSEEHEVDFNRYKNPLSKKPFLRIPDLLDDYILRTDASEKCLGDILMHMHGRTLHSVGYGSR